jgi:hypothetical protein
VYRYIELTPGTYEEAKNTIANDAFLNGKRFAGESDDEKYKNNNGPNKRSRSKRQSRSTSRGKSGISLGIIRILL